MHADGGRRHHHRHHGVRERGCRHRDDVGRLGKDSAQRPLGSAARLPRHVDVPIAREQQRREEVDGGQPEEGASVRRTVHPVAAVPAELRACQGGNQADEQQQRYRLAHPGRRDVLGRRKAVLVHERLIRPEHRAGDAQAGEASGHDRPGGGDCRESRDRAGQHETDAPADAAHDAGGGVGAQPEAHHVQRDRQGREARVGREQVSGQPADEDDHRDRRPIEHGGDGENREVESRSVANDGQGRIPYLPHYCRQGHQPFGTAAIIWISMSRSGAARSAVTVNLGGGRCSSKNSR